jgi:Zn-dependent protease with chaperone function
VAAATFFEHQQLARRNTRVMVVLFVLAVLAIVFTVDLVLGALYVWNSAGVRAPRGAPPSGLLQLLAQVPRQVYVWGALATAALVFIVSMVNTARLASGGAAVARMVGARRVPTDTRDPLERRLVNVVEEMAIASGVRVPAVYVMDAERGINAFAAGWDASGAVVTVTRGTLETLTRDELQGVIGHEFSHILNGDMRLNIRMLGVLAGIVFIGSIGSFIMRNVRGSRDDRGTGAIFFAGLALFVIGYLGLFFARLIKAKVSREREFLADASSVQFTRNPDGLAGALDQIRAASAGALIAGRHAEDMSHMYFGASVKLGGLFDTHPPIEERIERVRPGFQASAYRGHRSTDVEKPAPEAAGGAPAPGATGFVAGGASKEGRRPGDIETAWGRSAGDSAKLVGTISAGNISYAARLLASLPPALRASLREADGACAALIALLLAPAEDVMQRQLQALEAAGLSALAARARVAAADTRKLGPVFQLPIVDLALPALKAASDAARMELLAAFQAVIQADRRVSLHEFVVLTLVRHQLAPKAQASAPANKKLGDLQGQAATILALIAHAGTRADAAGARQEELQAAMRAGAKEMGWAEPPAEVGPLTLDTAAAALEALKGLAPLQKALLIKGLFAAATADGAIRVAEAELMRLTGAVLGCPLPPLLEELDPATLVA